MSSNAIEKFFENLARLGGIWLLEITLKLFSTKKLKNDKTNN